MTPLLAARLRAAAMVLAALSLPSLAACSGSSGSGLPDSPQEVTSVLSAHLTDAGIVADVGSLDCGDDASLVKGEVVACTFTADGQPVQLAATVTSVEGGTVGLDVATKAQPVPAVVLARDVDATLGEQLGTGLDAGTCAGDLQPEVGQSVTCTARLGSETRDVTVTVSAVTGGQLEYTTSPS